MGQAKPLSEQATVYVAESLLLFVYGTLKRGQCRHPTLANQRFIGMARTAPRYQIRDVGGYPGLAVQLPGKAIEGELWHISLHALRQLDAVESVAEGLYQRRPIELAGPHARRHAIAYFYLPPLTGPDCGTCW